LVPTLLDLLGVGIPADLEGISHATNLRSGGAQSWADTHSANAIAVERGIEEEVT
jgi:arylsulfatase A-like enzyme